MQTIVAKLGDDVEVERVLAVKLPKDYHRLKAKVPDCKVRLWGERLEDKWLVTWEDRDDDVELISALSYFADAPTQPGVKHLVVFAGTQRIMVAKPPAIPQPIVAAPTPAPERSPTDKLVIRPDFNLRRVVSQMDALAAVGDLPAVLAILLGLHV